MKRPNYTIIRCQTTDKDRVMDLLCYADDYKLIRDHVDAVYCNGDKNKEQIDTKRLVKANIATLIENGIRADSKNEYIDEWIWIQLHYPPYGVVGRPIQESQPMG